MSLADATAKLSGSDWIAPDCHGLNFYEIDPGFRTLLRHYMAPELHAHLEPHLDRLGAIAGGRLDELSRIADRHQPVLHHRDRFGRDEDWIEYHPAYREMERIAFEDFALNRLTLKEGAFGWPGRMGPLAKYAIQYLFVQSEFGLMCPISVTETSAILVDRYAEPAVRAHILPRMLAERREEVWTGAQFMTEMAGGSDVSRSEVTARRDGGVWRIHGDKWFCSHADGKVILMLARTDAGGPGSRGLSLFLVPRMLEDGRRNAYRIVRLKDKLGSRSMASGEVRFEGAEAYLMGQEGRGLKHMMDQVNLSRLSHGVRAAAMMRRCLNESLVVARNRIAFGERLIDLPLMRRQLMKIMLPTEQALSVAFYTASVMERAEAGDEAAARMLRILTPLLKFRTARDNVQVATAAMEARGGNGYIEDWVNARLVRDAHLGVLWEGTSSINALDVTTRAVAKERAHEALADGLHAVIEAADALPGQYRGALAGLIDRAVGFADEVAASREREDHSRLAADALYNVVSAVLLAYEGTVMGTGPAGTGDARRLLLSRLAVDHRLRPRDPLAAEDSQFDRQAAELLLQEEAVPLRQAVSTLAL
ncbi:MAG TPA: acyl-CoA dehydrogenase family protein [Alphaproteobacteria bacterium]|nr:acyl-CoA dehydrogenase family protein [Alphaproteobacteria bacterium]